MEIQYIKGTNLAYCNGYKFRKDKKTGYWLCTTLGKRLHRYVYEQYYGEIPKGYQVHHIDENKDNNDISNLKLMTISEHMKLHMAKRDKNKLRENLNKNARPKAIEWHKSKEGREWHKEQYSKYADKFHKKYNYTCKQCGKRFETININSKFCSNKCKSKWRRDNHIDDEERICVICGKIFKTNKYEKTITCSRKCASELRRRKEDRKCLRI